MIVFCFSLLAMFTLHQNKKKITCSRALLWKTNEVKRSEVFFFRKNFALKIYFCSNYLSYLFLKLAKRVFWRDIPAVNKKMLF